MSISNVGFYNESTASINNEYDMRSFKTTMTQYLELGTHLLDTNSCPICSINKLLFMKSSTQIYIIITHNSIVFYNNRVASINDQSLVLDNNTKHWCS